jgi:hypothetical protein
MPASNLKISAAVHSPQRTQRRASLALDGTARSNCLLFDCSESFAPYCFPNRPSFPAPFFPQSKVKIPRGLSKLHLGIRPAAGNIKVIGRLHGSKATSRFRTASRKIDRDFSRCGSRPTPRNSVAPVERSLLPVSAINRLQRQQLLREAEGYLDLALVFGDQWTLPADLRDCLAKRAIAVLEQLGESMAQSPQVQLIKGQALRMMECYKDALEPLAAAAEQDPQNVDTWLALGWCYKRTGRLDLAIESLEEALDVEPGSALVNYNLACYWCLAHNKRQSLAYLSQALSLDGAFRNLIDTEHDFDPLRTDPDFQALTSITV